MRKDSGLCYFHKRHLLGVAAALGILMSARVVYEYLPHQPRGDAEEVSAVLQGYILIHEAEVRFVY